MSISSIGSTVTNEYNSGLISMIGASGTGSSSSALTAGSLTNLEQASEDQTILAMNPSLTQTISQQAASPLLLPSSEALETIPGAGDSTTQSQSSLASLASSMQLLQNLSGSGALANNMSLAQSLLQNYANPANISPGSILDT